MPRFSAVARLVLLGKGIDMELMYKSDKKQSPVEVKINVEQESCDMSLNVVYAKLYMEQAKAVAVRSAVKDLRDLAAECSLAAAILERNHLGGEK